MKELIYSIRLLQIELILENDKLKNKIREINDKERRKKKSKLKEFPYKKVA